MLELDKVCKVFNENNIDYIRLKGIGMKKLYPRNEMRIMGDADILIRESQMDIIEKLMKGMGYKHLVTTDHEWTWIKDIFRIELHKRLMPTYNKDFYSYFGDGWDFVHKKSDNSCEYQMSIENEFIYIFTHFAKHYRYAGIGIKYVVDIYLFMETYCDLNIDYVNQAFRKLGIYGFFVNICKMLDVWFGGAECDEITEFLTNRIFRNGAYGTRQVSKKSEALVLSKGTDVKGARRKKMINLIFPTYKNMCPAYPWLKGKAWLLPVAWVYRIIKVLLFNRDKIKTHRNDMKAINKTNIDSYQAELNFVGLDFNFEV